MEIVAGKFSSPSEKLVAYRSLPSELAHEDLYRLGLVELVTLGYGYSGTKEELLEQAEFEYGGDDTRCINYFATSNHQIVGSLCVVRWFPEEPVRGRYFWQKLQDQNPKMAAQVLKDKAYPLCFAGLVTHPLYWRRGIARFLINTVVEEWQPFGVLGQSKSPALVAARSDTLAELDYRTFFGFQEVTPFSTHCGGTNLRDVLQAYTEGRKAVENVFGEDMSESGLKHEDPLRLTPEIPSLKGFPEKIVDAFADLVNEQKNRGSERTVVKVLTSIRSKYLGSNLEG
ncbi:hypothetical protein HYW42_05405 [Candidatus Daviesbacteria bacterium]|nr:hypothetical protein [Candidatus Daviesbacteria bacterium]